MKKFQNWKTLFERKMTHMSTLKLLHAVACCCWMCYVWIERELLVLTGTAYTVGWGQPFSEAKKFMWVGQSTAESVFSVFFPAKPLVAALLVISGKCNSFLLGGHVS